MTDQAIVWLDQLVDRAIERNSSDLHLEYIADSPPRLLVRVRHDGDLIPWPSLEGPDARAAVMRIKAVADVSSGAIRKPEEGRYAHRSGAGSLDAGLTATEYEEQSRALPRADIRLTVLPTIRGSKYVLRLQSMIDAPDITGLGLSRTNLGRVAGLFGWPNGLVLFAGPVGAGKSTSMRSAMQYLGGADKAAYSVEDPVEIAMENVDQMEVNDDAGNTFPALLRSVRRADVQVLMIGEIRDRETAYSSIDIAMAGARVVSSIHANDSVGAVEAMLTLSGATAHQVTQSLRGVVSQRLVKKVHAACAGEGCEDCQLTGVDGRLAIHEVLIVDADFAEAVAHGASRREMGRIARAGGMQSLREDAQRHLDSGQTTSAYLDEVLGTTGDDRA